MSGGRLLIAAAWTREGVADDDATAKVAEALREIGAPGSGAAVTVTNPNHSLRHWLRLVSLEEAADYEPAPAPSIGPETAR